MKYQKIPNTNLEISKVAVGHMHFHELANDKGAAKELIESALECGINFFDHADCYGIDSASEILFGEVAGFTREQREKLIIQSKVGLIKNGRPRALWYDFTRTHIIEGVEGILNRLKTDYLDILLLHRPDILMDPDEIAEAFDYLHSRGMVRYFGVSNMTPMTMKLIQKSVNQKLVVNQLQFSVAHTALIDKTLTMNRGWDQSFDMTGDALEYCMINDVQVQAYAPLQKRFSVGPFIGDLERYAKLNEVIERLAEKYGVSANAIAFAWIFRHPAKMQAITGTTKPFRLRECAAGADVTISRDEWYEMWVAAGNELP
jgi:predicted oxidoreductase